VVADCSLSEVGVNMTSALIRFILETGTVSQYFIDFLSKQGWWRSL
jgi:hypothetical protein